MAVDFAALYDLYNSNNLVIIVGSELLRMANEDLTFEQKVIEKIVQKAYTDEGTPKTYSELAIKKVNVDSNRLIGIFNAFDRQNNFDTNLLQLIADLPNVSLFISTAYDTKLEQLLGQKTESIIWNHKIKEPVYLNLQNGKRKVFYLFGNTNQGVSLFEEELIDCLMSLTSFNEVNKNKTPEKHSFLEYLKDKTLVFIGNNFPDWFMRLMLRTLYNATVTAQYNKAYIINDDRRILSFDKYFFDKYNIDLIHDFPIEVFLKDLHTYIRKEEDFDDWYKPREIFISYNRSDIEFARQLKQCLNAKHIKAFFDIDNMGIAEHEQKIISRISAMETCMFVCIISKFLVSESESESYVKRIEWETAGARFGANEFLKSVNQQPPPSFIITPVAIDNYNDYLDQLPSFITKNNILTFDLDKICELIENQIKGSLL